VTLVIDAELLDPGPPVPQPGFFHVIALARWRVLAVVEGAYEFDEVDVGHPDAQALKVGDRRRLRLVREFPDGVNVLGVENAGPGGAFFCVDSAPI
jgi:hypothetical protein